MTQPRQLDSSTVSTALDTTERCNTLDSLDSLDSAVKLSSSTVVDNPSTVVDSSTVRSTASTASTARAQAALPQAGHGEGGHRHLCAPSRGRSRSTSRTCYPWTAMAGGISLANTTCSMRPDNQHPRLTWQVRMWRPRAATSSRSRRTSQSTRLHPPRHAAPRRTLSR